MADAGKSSTAQPAMSGHRPLLDVDPAAVAWIRGQRTQLNGEDAAVAAGYAVEISRELDQIWPWLPKRLTRWIDIGCGMAGLSALLYKRLRQKPEQFYLLDGTGDSPVQAGWHDRALAPWNNRDAARAVLNANQVPLLRGEWLDVGTLHIDGPAVDLIVSTLSWGHHYPVGVYEPLVTAALAQGGRVMLDLRNGTDGEDALQRLGLTRLAVLPLDGINARKSTRQVWERRTR